MRYKLSLEAEEDIVAIAEQGMRIFGAQHARRYHNELFDLLDLIADNPRIARERTEIKPPIRIHPFKAHLIVYRIVEDDAVFIVRIRHGHEDWVSDAT
jgi:toxin ParE1/3/4